MAQRPDTAMKLKCGHSEFVVSDILLGLADIGVIFQKVYDDEIGAVEFFRSRFNLVVKKGLFNDKPPYITPENIQSYNPIMMEWGGAFNAWYSKYYKTQIHRYEIDGVSLFINMLLSGKGIGFLPDRISNTYIRSGQLECLDFKHKDTLPDDLAYIIFLRKNKTKVKDFLSFIHLFH